jgi:hypothetical protein
MASGIVLQVDLEINSELPLSQTAHSHLFDLRQLRCALLRVRSHNRIGEQHARRDVRNQRVGNLPWGAIGDFSRAGDGGRLLALSRRSQFPAQVGEDRRTGDAKKLSPMEPCMWFAGARDCCQHGETPARYAAAGSGGPRTSGGIAVTFGEWSDSGRSLDPEAVAYLIRGFVTARRRRVALERALIA